MLNDQTSTKEKKMKKTFQFIINSESVSISINHEKSDTKSQIMKLNQSDDAQQNLSLNNSHSSRQINSESDEDHFIKTSNANDDLKERFIKISNMKNDDLKKHECLKHEKSLIINQKEMKNNHLKTQKNNSNRIEKA